MHGRHMTKAPKLLLRGAVAFLLVLALSICSLSSVMANTVSANVIDGEQSYTFNMRSADLGSLLSQAQELGMDPLAPADKAQLVEGTTTVVVRRGVRLTLAEASKETVLPAYRGDTVGQALLENGIVLKDQDEVTPGRDTPLQGDTRVEIRRACQVTVLADGQERQVTRVGGTVADALEEAGVSVGPEDTVNWELDQPLYDKMHIRVARVMEITVTADGETQSYNTSAQTVEEALEKCGVPLSEEDRVEPAREEKVTDGMEITVRRVEVKEETHLEEIPYETEYRETDALYEGETQVESYGAPGEKEVTYQVTYVEGEVESREAVSEEVIAEPVAEVVLVGTAWVEEESPAPEAGGSSSSGNTFVDASGNVVSYSTMLTGTCTAYYAPPGGTTSLGWAAVRGVIAVNPNVIPYGTRMYVTSPDGSVVYGYGVAGDTGGACMAGTILADLCYDTEAECSQIGRRTMNIYILD